MTRSLVKSVWNKSTKRQKVPDHKRHSPTFPISARGHGEKWFWLAAYLLFALQPLHAGNPDAEAWAQKGSKALAAGDYPTAVDFFQRAVDADPSEVSYLVDLANAFIQAGQFGEGQHALELG